MAYKTICLICFLHFIISSYSQVLQSESPIRTLTVNDGLPQGQVRGMVQDKQGFIWIASEGLSRYDGRSFINYFHILGDSASLADNDIRRLQIDDRDNLWIMYGSGQTDVKNVLTGQVRHITAEPAFRWLMKGAPQNRYIIRQAGGQYFAATWKEIIAFEPTTGKHHMISLPAGEKLLALGGNIKEKALLATPKALYEIKDNQLHRLINFPVLSNTQYQHWDSVISGSGSSNVIGDGVGQTTAYPNRNLAITAVDGIFVYDGLKRSCSYLPDNNSSGRKLTYSLPLAADSNIYLSFFAGIYRLSGTQPPQLVFSNGGHGEYYGALLADRSGTLLADAGVLGIRLFDLQPENFRSFKPKNSFSADVLQPWLPADAYGNYYGSYGLRSAKDTGKNVWVLNVTHKFLRNNKSNRWPAIFSLHDPLRSRFAFNDSILEPLYFTFDKLNQCWLVFFDVKTENRILAKLNLNTGKVTPFLQLPKGWKENGYLTAINNKVCYLTDEEIRLYDTMSKSCTVFTGNNLGVAGSLLMAIPAPQEKDILWIATKSSGIVKLNIVTGVITHYTMANGLPNNTVYFMAPDKRDQFWCSSNKGLYRFNPANGGVTAFTVKDGIQGNEFNRYHFLETPDGHFTFGGTEGYTVFHPDSVQLDHFQPPVAITEILVNNEPLQQAAPGWKDSATTTLQRLTLAYHQNFLTFGFAGLQYNAPEKLQYRYQLQGVDKDWVAAGTNATAKYASIPPGHYTLQVNASNTAGVWSSHVKTLEITILPPWWKTWWAYAIYIFVIAAIVYALYRTWLQRVQDRQQVILKEKEAAQAQAMEETKSRFFANITHELRTPLTLILSPVQKQLQEGESTYSPALLKNIYHNAQLLLRQINQLLDMSKLESGSLPIHLSKGSMALFLQELVNGFKNAAAAKKIDLSYDATHLPDEYLFDSDKLEKILYNLLGNALKFTPEGGGIRVVLSEQSTVNSKSTCCIQVLDTGIGISPENLPHIFNRFYQVNNSTTRRYEGAGIGLSLVKELAELMGGEINAESSIGKGSVFTLTLPLSIADAVFHFPKASQPRVIENIADENEAAQPSVTGNDQPLVLVTEDNEQLRIFITGCLQTHYRVLTAANGEAGWQAAVSELPELIISDVMMPVMDGYEFCSKVKENPLTAHIGFVMLTAKRADESRMGGLRLGADYYLGKPFIVEELLLVVSNLIKRQQKLREHYNRQLQPGEKLPPVAEIEDTFLQSVYTIIENNLNSDSLDVEFLASELAVSRRTLNRKLAAVANTSANEIIRSYRLKKAAGLLLSGQNVSEAAYTTGFSTPSWFSQCFKEMYGITPVQYAENGGMSQN